MSELINDDEFGQLFIGDDDLAEVTKKAIRDLHPIDKDKFEKKLYEISAENFAKKFISSILTPLLNTITLSLLRRNVFQ